MIHTAFLQLSKKNFPQMTAEEKISFEIICLISGNQRGYLRKSAGKTGKFSADYRKKEKSSSISIGMLIL